MSDDLLHSDLGDRFSRYFEIVPALDEATRHEAFRVRHSVYCEDLGFEAPRASGEETDTYDAHSLHCVLRTRGQHARPIGCSRLIVAKPGAEDEPLPFEKYCAETLDRSIIDPARLPRRTVTEVSRLAVISDFRKRKEEQDKPVAISDDDFRNSGPTPRFPFIPVSLYLASISMALHEGLEHMFVLTEPRLASHFAKIGFDIRQIGGAVEHRGTRVPSYLRPTVIADTLRPMIRPLFQVVRDSVERAYAKQ